MKLRNISIGLSGLVLLGLVCMVGYQAFGYNDGVIDVVIKMIAMPFMLLFYGFPPIVSIMLAYYYFKKTIPLIIAMAASLLYVPWFAYIYHDAFYANVDPQSAILLVWVGIYFLPVLSPLLLTAIIIEYRSRKKLQS